MSFLYYQYKMNLHKSVKKSMYDNKQILKLTNCMKIRLLFVMNKNDDDDDNVDGNIKLATNPETKIPALYRVLMMNDDYTPMEFVIEVLEKFFQKNKEEATQIMLHVHQRGVGVCGVYAYDLAETKAMQVMNYARKYEHPLQVQLEKE